MNTYKINKSPKKLPASARNQEVPYWYHYGKHFQ
jgi:hypothetical protein